MKNEEKTELDQPGKAHEKETAPTSGVNPVALVSNNGNGAQAGGIKTGEVVDVEEHGKKGIKPPLAERYKIRIDKTHHEVATGAMTGRQLLELAGKIPAEQYMISEKLNGGQANKIGLNETADFTKPGVERFMTLPLDQTEG